MLARNKANKSILINEILLALQQANLKKLNEILNNTSRQELIEILTINITKDLTISSFFGAPFGTPLGKLIHRLDYKNINEGLENLPDRLEQSNAVQFFLSLLTKIDTRLRIKYRSGENWPSRFLYPFLCECACGAYFDRTLYPRRTHMENNITCEALERFPVDTTTQLNYLSYGSGLLLQDFILIFKLILAGYALNIRLIEIQSDSESFKNALRQLYLLSYAAAEKNLSFCISVFATAQEYRNKFPDHTIHVAHALDMPFLPLVDLFAVYTSLQKKGFFYMADRFHNILLTRNQLLFSKKYSRANDANEYKVANLDYDELKQFPVCAAVNKILAPQVDNNKNIISDVLGYLGLFAVTTREKGRDEIKELSKNNFSSLP